jgi:hypothetical protein
MAVADIERIIKSGLIVQQRQAETHGERQREESAAHREPPNVRLRPGYGAALPERNDSGQPL